MESEFTNLRQYRSEGNAWNARGRRSRAAGERIAVSLASIAGAALVLYGATRRRRSTSGMWWLVGGAVAGCAAASLGAGQWLRNTRFGSEPLHADVVMQESEDSFPASDAPSFSATTATARPLRRDVRTD